MSLSKRVFPAAWPERVEREHSILTLDDLYKQNLYSMARQFEEIRAVSQEEHIRDLKKRVAHLESLVEGKVIKTGGEGVYERLLPSLQGSRGKFVAIDTEKGVVAGSGDSLMEAYEDANSRTGKEQFYFRKVGSKSVLTV